VLVAQLEGLLDAMLGPRLDEVELAVLEPQVGAVGVDEVARDLLALGLFAVLGASRASVPGIAQVGRPSKIYLDQ